MDELVNAGRINQPFNPDHEDKLGFCRDIIGAFLLGEASKTDLFTFCIAVFFHVSLCALENHTALRFLSLYI